MTLIEARDILINRIGFSDEFEDQYALSVENNTSDSQRFFQEEYTWLTLLNIYETANTEPVNDDQFNRHLAYLRRIVVIKVLSDVFINGYADKDKIECNISIFDTAISQRMAIVVGEQILTTSRSNFVQRVTKEFMSTIFFEVDGNSEDDKINDDFPTNLGLKSRYGLEVKRLRDYFNTDSMLDVHTIGLGRNDELSEDEQYWS